LDFRRFGILACGVGAECALVEKTENANHIIAGAIDFRDYAFGHMGMYRARI